MYHHRLAGKFPHVWDPPQVLFSWHGKEATDTDVKAREKCAVKLFATRLLFSLFSLNLVHSVLCNAAASNHRNCLHRHFGCVFEANGDFHFQRNYHDFCTTTKVNGLKFFNITRSWTRCYHTCCQAPLHYLYLLHVKEFSYKLYVGKSFSVCYN